FLLPGRGPGEALQALDGHVAVPGVDVHAVAPAAEQLAGDERAPRAAEGIEHDLALPGAVGEHAPDEFHGLGRGVLGGGPGPGDVEHRVSGVAAVPSPGAPTPSSAAGAVPVQDGLVAVVV